tara:strand:+ start:905 stop:1462 length:558 start_codon:yes stop_codon:yes gene_type:complete
LIIQEIKHPLVINHLSKHKSIKDKLLQKIKTQNSKSFVKKQDGINDNIHKLDWNSHSDFTRPWVKFFLPYFEESIAEIINKLKFKEVLLHGIWFQQYDKNGTHGWHTHGNNFTGVYYLDLPKDSPATQICNPMNQEEVIDLNVKEGDIIIFPSFVVHRAPYNKSNSTKTIISFNLDLENPTKGDE